MKFPFILSMLLMLLSGLLIGLAFVTGIGLFGVAGLILGAVCLAPEIIQFIKDMGTEFDRFD